MKSIIFCTSYIDDSNDLRYKKWVDYYIEIKHLLNSEHLFLIDDSSPNPNFDTRVEIISTNNLPDELNQNVNLFHFENHLGRPGRRDYQGWWRSFTFSIKLAEKYNIEKLIHIESDYYILSRRMIDHIAGISEGWTVFYSDYYKFPETAVQVICKDSFDKFNTVYNQAINSEYKFKKIAERILPFTKVEKNFTGDRLGEIKVFRAWLKKYKLPLEIDFVGQVNEEDNPEVYQKFFRLHL